MVFVEYFSVWGKIMNLKSILAAAALALVAPFANAAVFTDCTPFSAVTNGGSGIAQEVAAGPQVDCAFQLISNNNGTGGLDTAWIATATADMTVVFDWDYETFDVDGPAFDPFGYIINGVKTQLTDNAGPDNQDGTGETFNVLAGDIFGWYIEATDGILGAAVDTTAANFSPIPLPASALLLLGGLGGLTVLRKKKKA